MLEFKEVEEDQLVNLDVTERYDKRVKKLALRDHYTLEKKVDFSVCEPYIGALEPLDFFHNVLPLTAEQHRQCLNWCQKWQPQEVKWQNVVFSDKSRLCLRMNVEQRMIKCHPGGPLK